MASALLSGCTGPVESGTCVDWVSYETDDAMAVDATLVVEGQVVRQTGEVELFGETAPEYEVRVDDVVKGQADPGDVIRVALTPETCAGDDATSPPGLDVDRAYTLYLEEVDGATDAWSTITAMQGAVPADG